MTFYVAFMIDDDTAENAHHFLTLAAVETFVAEQLSEDGLPLYDYFTAGFTDEVQS